MTAASSKQASAGQSGESIPILGSPPNTNGARKDRAPQKYTEKRESIGRLKIYKKKNFSHFA